MTKNQKAKLTNQNTPEFHLYALNALCFVICDSKATEETRAVVAVLIQEQHAWFNIHEITLVGDGFSGFCLAK